MRRFFLRVIINALGLAVAAYIIPGIRFSTIPTLFFAALLLGMVNAFVRPLFFILTLPFTILTLGLFILVINGVMLILVAYLLPGFSIDSLGAAILGWIVLSLFSWLIGGSRESR